MAKFEHGSIIYREEEPRKDSGTVWAQIICEALLHLRATQGHSGGYQIDLRCKTTWSYQMTSPKTKKKHVGSCHDLHSITRSGFVASVDKTQKEAFVKRAHWQTEFDLM